MKNRTFIHKLLGFCGIGFVVRDCLKLCYSVSTETVLTLVCRRMLELDFKPFQIRFWNTCNAFQKIMFDLKKSITL